MNDTWGTRIEDWDPKFFSDAMCEYFRNGGHKFSFLNKADDEPGDTDTTENGDPEGLHKGT